MARVGLRRPDAVPSSEVARRGVPLSRQICAWITHASSSWPPRSATALGAKHPDDLAPDDPSSQAHHGRRRLGWTPTPAQTSCETLKFAPESAGLGEAGANKLGPLLARNHKLEALARPPGPGRQRREGDPLVAAGAPSLTQLHLSHNSIGSAGASALALELIQPGNRWEQLVLHNNAIGAEGFYGLANALRRNVSLSHLDLRSNRGGPSGGRALADSLRSNRMLKQRWSATTASRIWASSTFRSR